MNQLKGFAKYSPLLKEFVFRDIKTRYRRSFLGLLWTLLNPIFTMLIMTVVFSKLFRIDVPNFPVYLLSAQAVFNFFSESTTNAMSSIIGGSSLIKKIYIPKYLFPLSKILSTLINFISSFIALLVVMVFTGVKLKISVLFFIFPLFYLMLFSFGMGLILSSVAVKFRDTIHFYGVLLTLWTYLTPLFYPIEILPHSTRIIVQMNPLTNISEFMRLITLYGTAPPAILHIICLLPSLVILLCGLWIFYSMQDKFILHM